MIICNCVHQTKRKNLQSPKLVSLWCIEKTPSLFASLESNLSQVEFATARQGFFSDYAEDIAAATKNSSVFLYVDPFTVEGLIWNELESIYQGLNRGSSVEILLNLNSASFIRRGLAALNTDLDGLEGDDESDDPVDADIKGSPQIEALDRVAGGTWWQDIIRERNSFPQTVEKFTSSYCERIKNWFNQVVYHPI